MLRRNVNILRRNVMDAKSVRNTRALNILPKSLSRPQILSSTHDQIAKAERGKMKMNSVISHFFLLYDEPIDDDNRRKFPHICVPCVCMMGCVSTECAFIVLSFFIFSIIINDWIYDNRFGSSFSRKWRTLTQTRNRWGGNDTNSIYHYAGGR